MNKQLYLICGNVPIKIHKPMCIGRSDFRAFSENYKFVSDQQLVISNCAGDWFVVNGHNLVNNNYLNKKLLSSKMKLNNNDKILIGNIHTDKGLRIEIIIKEIDKDSRDIRPDEIALNFNWIDYSRKNWEWNFNLPKKYLKESKEKFGITGKIINGNIHFQNSYKAKKIESYGLKRKNGYINIDYPNVTNDNTPFVTEVTLSLKKMFNVNSKYELLNKFLNFVQSIHYKAPPSESSSGKIICGLITPIEILVEQYGDCDSKAVLLASIWRNLYNDPIYFGIIKNHVIIGFSNVKDTSHLHNYTVRENGVEYLCCEAAGPAITYPGLLGKRYKIIDCQILE
jgi:hypothetical protein